MKIETLKKVIVPKESLYRYFLKECWQINFSGLEYTLATNGKIMIIVRNTTNEFLPLDAEGCKRVLPYLQEPVEGVEMPLSKVKDWAGAYVPEEKRPCARCKATGRWICPGGKACECSEDFEFIHFDPEEIECPDCDGSGSINVVVTRLGRVGHLQINMNLLAQVLETAEADRIKVHAGKWSLTITADHWRAWIMGFYKPNQEALSELSALREKLGGTQEPIPVLDYPEEKPPEAKP